MKFYLIFFKLINLFFEILIYKLTHKEMNFST